MLNAYSLTIGIDYASAVVSSDLETRLDRFRFALVDLMTEKLGATYDGSGSGFGVMEMFFADGDTNRMAEEVPALIEEFSIESYVSLTIAGQQCTG